MKQTITVATVAAALAIAASPVSAQTATTTDSTATATAVTAPTAYTAARTTPRTDATPQMISEALERSKARHDKFLANGTPEKWGSEEPFVFDPTKAAVQ